MRGRWSGVRDTRIFVASNHQSRYSLVLFNSFRLTMPPTSLSVDLATAFKNLPGNEYKKVFIPICVEDITYSREQFLLAAFLRHASKEISFFHVAHIFNRLVTAYESEKRLTHEGDERKDFLCIVGQPLLDMVKAQFANSAVFDEKEMNVAEHVFTTLLAYLIHEFPEDVASYITRYALQQEYFLPVLLDPRL